MRLLILLILSPFFLFSQTQIGNDIDGIAAGDGSGIVSFSNDGTVVAIGGPGNDDAGADAGHVRVFENSTGNWVQIGNTITGEVAGDNFGASLSLSSNGSILAIGAPYNDDGGDNAGHVRVFENSSGDWVKIGNTIYGEAAGDYFGISVSISENGNILAIGEDRGPNWFEPQYGSIGFVHLYENISGTWTQIGDTINTEITNLTNVSLSSDGSTVAIFGKGDYYFVLGGYIGFVNIFKNISGSWTQVGSTFSGGFYNIISDVSLSNDGSKLAIGGISTKVYEIIGNDWNLFNESIELTNIYEFPGQVDISGDGSLVAISGFDNTSGQNYGFVRVYKSGSGTWIKKGSDIIGEGLGDGYHNVNLSSNGNKIAIGSATNDGNGIDTGHVRVYDLSALLSSDDFVLSQFSLFPNPAKNQFTISLIESIVLDHINIYNQLAQLISSTQETTISTSLLSSGMYYVEVITNQGRATKKLIIE